MQSILRLVRGPRPLSSPWSDIAPVREELFGIERLEQHAESLAAAQSVTARPPHVLSLHARLRDNAAVLLAAYRASAAELESGRGEVPAAEWLLDNYHLVEEHIREIKDDLPTGYYRQLPKLADGPFAGYPRVFGLAWGFVAHTDSHFDPDSFRRFVAAYQRVQPLTIGELWAAAITLRIVLVENLRRLADQMSAGRQARAAAEALADRLLATGCARSALDDDIAQRSAGPLSALFAAQLAKRLRDQDPRTMPALGWLEDRLRLQGASVDDVVREAQQRQGASNVTVRNVITSMRLISDIDWSELFESVSLVDERLRAASPFGGMDFHTRNLYRSAIETLSRGAALSELAIVDHALAAAVTARATTTDALEIERLGDPGYHLIAGGAAGFRARHRLSPAAAAASGPLQQPVGHRRLCGHDRLGHLGFGAGRRRGGVRRRFVPMVAGAGRMPRRAAGQRGGHRPGQPRRRLELRRRHLAGTGLESRGAILAAHLGGGADVVDRRGRSA